MNTKDIPQDRKAELLELSKDTPLSAEFIGDYARKDQFHGKPTDVIIKDLKTEISQWGKKRYLMTVETEEENDLILTLGKADFNKLLKLLGPVFNKDWYQQVITVETTQHDYLISGEKTQGYEYKFSKA